MGRGNVLKRLFVLTLLSLLYSPVYAEVTLEKANSEKYSAGGFKYVTTSCDVSGIAADYANVGFIKGFLPKDRQDGLKKVVWDPKAKKMQVEAKQNYTLACEESKKGNSVSITCKFDPVPVGVNYLWFKITRTKEDSLCAETAYSEGQFNNLVRAKFYSPEGLHKQVASAFVAPYLTSATASGSGNKHAARVTRAPASAVTTK